MQYKDYYKILGISRTASEDEIKKAFRKRAKETHPDANLDTPKAESTARFQEIGEAYQALENTNSKKDTIKFMIRNRLFVENKQPQEQQPLPHHQKQKDNGQTQKPNRLIKVFIQILGVFLDNPIQFLMKY